MRITYIVKVKELYKIDKPKFEESSYQTLNFLYKKDKFFVMDNHRAAAWCWFTELDITKKYGFVHIDMHYDLLDQKQMVQEVIVNTELELNKLKLQEYLDLSYKDVTGRNVVLFRYDNFILNTSFIYPNLFSYTLFSTHDIDNREDSFINYDISFLSLDKELHHYINKDNKRTYILDLDLDFFFKESSTLDVYQFLSDEYVKSLCESISKAIDNIEIITIALSPECCDGWDNANRIMKIISDYFNLGFDIDKYI